ncbi:uncharacterized protein LOC141857645 [Brevipalpus obovatus]|uniref:uncharacterized protein LOC141857645 n=1 Tax=Brevipalpus obovatus TaxID=246614 RepID=UPI003D9EDD29
MTVNERSYTLEQVQAYPTRINLRPVVTVKIRYGLIQGTHVQRLYELVSALYGIPYAKPPNDKRKFLKPESIDSWRGILRPNHSRPACIKHHIQISSLVPEIRISNVQCQRFNIDPRTLVNIERKYTQYTYLAYAHGSRDSKLVPHAEWTYFAQPQPNQPLLAPQVQMLFAPLLANLANNMHLPNQNPNQLQPGQPGASQQAASGSAGPSSTSTSANSSASPSATSVSSSIPAASSASVSTHVLRSVLALPGFVPFVPLTQSTTASSPPNLSSLSDDELRRMEGTEREAIESRIRVLLNVKSLLDSAVAQLNQYQMVAGPISVNINNHSDGSTLRTGAKEGEPKQEPSEEKKERDTVITKRRVATQTNEDSGVDQFKSVKSKASTQERG